MSDLSNAKKICDALEGKLWLIEKILDNSRIIYFSQEHKGLIKIRCPVCDDSATIWFGDSTRWLSVFWICNDRQCQEFRSSFYGLMHTVRRNNFPDETEGDTMNYLEQMINENTDDEFVLDE